MYFNGEGIQLVHVPARQYRRRHPGVLPQLGCDCGRRHLQHRRLPAHRPGARRARQRRHRGAQPPDRPRDLRAVHRGRHAHRARPRAHQRRIRRGGVPRHGHHRARPGAGARGEGADARAGEGLASHAGLGAALRLDHRGRGRPRSSSRRCIAASPAGKAASRAPRRDARRSSRWPPLPAPRGRPPRQFDITGSYNAMFHEDQPERIPGPSLGDYLGLPINESARAFADAWDASRLTVPEHQCRAHSSPYILRGPLNMRIWDERARRDAAGGRHPHRHQQLPATPDGVDGRPPASVAVRRAHLDGVFDRPVGGRGAGRDHHPHQADVAPAQRAAAERSGDAHRALLAARPGADLRHHYRRPGVSDRAAGQDHQHAAQPAAARAAAAALPVHCRRRDRQPAARRGAALPSGAEPVPEGIRRGSSSCPRRPCAAAPRRCTRSSPPRCGGSRRGAAGLQPRQPVSTASTARRGRPCRPRP